MKRRTDEMMQLRLATIDDIAVVVKLSGAYHEFENIESDDETRRAAILTLLTEAQLGRLWLIEVESEVAGYIALCFGYSLEFAGRDAFVDEFYIEPAYRGRGIGSDALQWVLDAARSLDIKAVHLEVAKANKRAARLYGSLGFVARSKYQLMTRDLD